jgi:trk system potassium uptake protein TrkA
VILLKQFVVLGLGRFGTSVAKSLYQMGHDVLAVDIDEDVVQDISDSVTHAVQADVTEEDALRALGLRNFDVGVVAIGSNIQASTLVTLIVKEMGVKYVVAKAQNELHAKLLYRIGADKVVFPERDMGVRLAHNLVSSNVIDFIELAPDFSIVEMAAPEAWCGKTLKQLDIRRKYGINVVAVKDGDNIRVSPSADYMIKDGDALIVIGNNGDVARIERGI